MLSRALFITAGIITLAGMGAYALTSWNNHRILPLIIPTPQANFRFSPTSLPHSVQTASISNWKTYTNSTYGYSIQYPPEQSMLDMSDAKVDTKGADCVEVGLPGTPYDDWPTLYIETIAKNAACYNNDMFMQNLNQEINSMKVGDVKKSDRSQFTRQANITLDGDTAYVFELKGLADEKRVVMRHNNILYVIGGYGSYTQFNQMISTFKLISD